MGGAELVSGNYDDLKTAQSLGTGKILSVISLGVESSGTADETAPATILTALLTALLYKKLRFQSCVLKRVK